MSERVIPEDVLAVQQRASDPAVSAWVSANAGSGKTYVLAQRVVRLLLDGTDPAKILSLTFTKAAAANMANRVFDVLTRWTALDDAALDAEIRKTGLKRTTPALRARARKLFAAALETPGGLKVQTIHAFCTRLLQQFPFEANVAARFRVLEDTLQRQFLQDLRLDVLLAAAAAPTSAVGKALATIITLASDQAFQDGLKAAIENRDGVTAWLAHAGSIDGAMEELSRSLGIAPDDDLARAEADTIDGPILPSSQWESTAAVFATGSANDRDQAARLGQAMAAHGSERVEAYQSVFLTQALKPRSSVITAPLAKKNPDLARRLGDEQNRICAMLERRRAIVIRKRTRALLTLAEEVIRRYATQKAQRGLLDYDDLIDRTRKLLTRVESAWVHYKLDLGIDHLLIDEAQDTSPEQWDIIKRLVAEFAAGAGARGTTTRSIFAVGDDKQSIFSFQGAVPQEFDAMRRIFRQNFEAAEREWRDVRLSHSFRSGEGVLAAVEQVFREETVFRSITSDAGGISRHLALPKAAPALVELWDIVEPDDRPAVEPWDAPFDKTSETSPRVKLARRIARAVRTWIGSVHVGNEDDRRPARPGDILILVRQRGPLFEAIIRALKHENIAVAGADRLVLTDHIAVMDLLALADAVLLRDDDLALATVLKSPLFGLSEDALFDLAWDRTGTLRAALAARRSDLAAHVDTIERDARRLSPFAFYAKLLGAGGGRARILARLGHEANDALDEFLNLALDYESRETPTLQGFVAWLRTSSAEIKRDMEIARDEVRVMTVHGAKGLEAPIVILADTTTHPEGPPQYQPRLLALAAQGAAPGTPDRLVWMPSKQDDTAPIAAARAAALSAAEDEYRRLLYVAMTRAADRLMICGAVGMKAMPKGCWYRLVEQGLAATDALIEEPSGFDEERVRRYRKGAAASDDGLPQQPPAPAQLASPAWLRTPAPPEPATLAAITPSSDDEVFKTRGEAGEVSRRVALLRGTLVHRLMQSLPDIVPERRAETAQRFLARSGKDLPAAEHAPLLKQIFAVLDDKRFASLFVPGTRAEVPIVGRVTLRDKTRRLVSGQIDRLAVTDDAVLIADYKTNRPAPQRVEDVPRAYRRQLALYRALLGAIYPGRAIRAALVWTDVPDLMELSAAAMDAEIDALIRS